MKNYTHSKETNDLVQGRGGVVSQAWIWYRCAAGPPHTHPINVCSNMEKVYLYMYKPSLRITSVVHCFHLDRIISCRKPSIVIYWNINWFLSESNKITWRDKGQVVRFSTAGEWMEGYKCISEMKSWSIDVQITRKMGAIPAARLYHTKYREFPPPPPHTHKRI